MENILSWTRSILVTTPARWEQMVRNVPLELLTRQPAAGEWSALECLQHILDTEAVFVARVGYFRAGQDFPGFNPDTEGSKAAETPEEMSARLSRLRQASLALLDELAPADLARQARHAELGMVTLDEMVHEWAVHDLNHTVQAERAMMQPFLQGCGPWVRYCQDHLVQ